jgi:hypothetical protein
METKLETVSTAPGGLNASLNQLKNLAMILGHALLNDPAPMPYRWDVPVCYSAAAKTQVTGLQVPDRAGFIL